MPIVNTSQADHLEEDVQTSTPIENDSEIEPATQIQKNHLVNNIIGELDQGMTTRKKDRVDYRKMEELVQYEKNEVWELVPTPDYHNMIGTKWIFKNKSDEYGNITRNKVRLVAQGYTQIEGLYFDETFVPVARLEAIILLLSLACLLKFKLYQMDVKSAFFNRIIQEEVYVEQPKGFVDPSNPDHVYRLKKALYGLKKAPRDWYERLTTFLLKNGYTRGGVDNTLFIKKKVDQLMVAQILS
ncbi:transmembrane signal receptor [Lithospermum erythrorhizon]|uniref:Transmembrane signal receptor n=1 Tax=Lithospermum erythrorhizon TaxID=34254 RepID=A0AAV3PD55_LITER